MKHKQPNEPRRGVPMQEGASHPANICSGWGFNSYFTMTLAMYLYTIVGCIFAAKATGAGNILVGIIVLLALALSFLALLCRMFVRLEEVIRYQHRGMEAQVKQEKKDGKLIYTINKNLTPDDERAIRNGFKSAAAALNTLTFVENLPGIAPANPPQVLSPTNAAQPIDIDKLTAEITHRVKMQMMATLSNPPSEQIPTKPQPDTKTPPSPSKKPKATPPSPTSIKCPECGKECMGEFGLRAHMRARHKKEGVD